MRKLSLFVVAVAAGSAMLLSAGCQSAADPIVGNWIADVNFSGTTGTAEATYGADGSFSATTKIKSPMGQGEIQAIQKGKWAYDDNKNLKVTLDSMETKLVGGTPELKKIIEGANTPEQKAAMIEQANKAPATKVTWKGNDEFTTSMNNQALVFKRKK